MSNNHQNNVYNKNNFSQIKVTTIHDNEQAAIKSYDESVRTNYNPNWSHTLGHPSSNINH